MKKTTINLTTDWSYETEMVWDVITEDIAFESHLDNVLDRVYWNDDRNYNVAYSVVNQEIEDMLWLCDASDIKNKWMREIMETIIQCMDFDKLVVMELKSRGIYPDKKPMGSKSYSKKTIGPRKVRR